MSLPNDVSSLKSLLQDLMANARANEILLKRMQDTEFRLVSANTFPELMHALLVDLPAQYELAGASLVLVDPEYEIQRILYELGVDVANHPHLIFKRHHAELTRLTQGRIEPQLGLFLPDWHAPLFPSLAETPASIALLPLVRREELIGCLALASQQDDRFAHGMGTDFIGRLGAIAAICVENVINSERLRHIGLTDPLTGVHNRRYFDERLREEVDRQQRAGGALSCVFIDIDHFKLINDNHGHPAGDCVLREVAGRIKTELRISDTLGRYGGEEFAVLLVQTDENQSVAVAERIRRRIADLPCLTPDGQPLTVTVSLGVTTLRSSSEQDGRESLAKRLLTNADTALYRSKETGRNKVTVALPRD